MKYLKKWFFLMFNSLKFSMVVSIFMLYISSLNAAENKYCWGADDKISTGISVDVETKSMISIYRSFVFVEDRMGIRNAIMVAEEGAKNQMIRFLSQSQYTEREIINSNKIESSTTKLTDSLGKENSNAISREMSQIINEYTRSTASEILNGIEKIEESYKPQLLEVCVTLRMNSRTKEMSKKIKEW